MYSKVESVLINELGDGHCGQCVPKGVMFTVSNLG